MGLLGNLKDGVKGAVRKTVDEKRGMYRENIPNLYVFGSKFTNNYSLIYD